jgi:hypothetical protein
MKTTTVSRFVVVNDADRIVATCGGHHAMMERICSRLDHSQPGTYRYDDASNAAAYLPQVGPNISLSGR